MSTSNNAIIYLNKTPMYKILLLGESNVGKTSLKRRFVEDSFQIDYKATVGIDYKIKCINLNGNNSVRLSIWDTAGQERFRSITRSYLNNANGIILCFDITDRNSFNEIANFWIGFADNYSNKSNCISILVGTKMDKQNFRKVSYEEAKKLADDLNILYIETSSMKNVNVDDLFHLLGQNIYNLIELNKTEVMVKEKQPQTFFENSFDKKKKRSCCK